MVNSINNSKDWLNSSNKLSLEEDFASSTNSALQNQNMAVRPAGSAPVPHPSFGNNGNSQKPDYSGAPVPQPPYNGTRSFGGGNNPFGGLNSHAGDFSFGGHGGQSYNLASVPPRRPVAGNNAPSDGLRSNPHGDQHYNLASVPPRKPVAGNNTPSDRLGSGPLGNLLKRQDGEFYNLAAVPPRRRAPEIFRSENAGGSPDENNGAQPLSKRERFKNKVKSFLGLRSKTDENSAVKYVPLSIEEARKKYPGSKSVHSEIPRASSNAGGKPQFTLPRRPVGEDNSQRLLENMFRSASREQTPEASSKRDVNVLPTIAEEPAVTDSQPRYGSAKSGNTLIQQPQNFSSEQVASKVADVAVQWLKENSNSGKNGAAPLSKADDYAPSSTYMPGMDDGYNLPSGADQTPLGDTPVRDFPELISRTPETKDVLTEQFGNNDFLKERAYFTKEQLQTEYKNYLEKIRNEGFDIDIKTGDINKFPDGYEQKFELINNYEGLLYLIKVDREEVGLPSLVSVPEPLNRAVPNTDLIPQSPSAQRGSTAIIIQKIESAAQKYDADTPMAADALPRGDGDDYYLPQGGAWSETPVQDAPPPVPPKVPLDGSSQSPKPENPDATYMPGKDDAFDGINTFFGKDDESRDGSSRGSTPGLSDNGFTPASPDWNTPRNEEQLFSATFSPGENDFTTFPYNPREMALPSSPAEKISGELGIPWLNNEDWQINSTPAPDNGANNALHRGESVRQPNFSKPLIREENAELSRNVSVRYPGEDNQRLSPEERRILEAEIAADEDAGFYPLTR